MTFLITGGAGFIGSHVCERLLRAAHRVIILDDLNDFYSPALKLANLKEVGRVGQFEFHQADIRDAAAVRQVFLAVRPAAVIHLAARAGVRPSLQDPTLYATTNYAGTLSLLEAMRAAQCARLVFASSSSVYGERSHVPFRETDDVSRPISPYAASKVACEQLIYTYSRLYGISAVCLRLFTVHGPRQRPDLAIRKFYELLVRELPVQMFGDGTTGRDYTYIDDIVDAFEAALRLDRDFEILNVGDSHPILLRHVIDTIASVLGVRPRIEMRPAQPGDVSITFADISKATELLGYRPTVAFEEGVERFHAWFSREIA